MIINKDKVCVFLCITSCLSMVMLLVFDKMRLDSYANICFFILTFSGLSHFIFKLNNYKLERKSALVVFFSYFCVLILLIISCVSDFSISVFISGVKFSLFLLVCSWLCISFYYNLEKVIFSVTICLFLCLVFVLNASGWNLSIKMMTVFYNPNSLGMIMSVGVFFSLFGLLNSKYSLIYIPFLLAFTIICLYSNSRTAIISPFLSYTLWVFCLPFFIKSTRPIFTTKLLIKSIALIVFLVACLNNQFLVNTVNDTIVNKFESKDDVTSGRFDYIASSIKEVEFMSTSEPSSYLIVDNTYVAYAYDFGLMFSFFMIGIIFLSFYLLLFRFRIENKAMGCMVFVSIINYVTYSNLESIRFTPQSMLFFMAFFFLILNVNKKYV